MGLPRHLRDKFSSTDGAPIADATTATAGTNATSGPDTQQQNAADRTQRNELGDQLASTTTAATQRHDQTAVVSASTGADAAASSQPVIPAADGVDDGSAATGDENFRRMEGRYKAENTRLKGLLEKAEEASRGTSQITDFLAETRQELAEAKRRLDELQAGSTSTASSQRTGKTDAAAQPDVPELTEQELAMYGDFAPVAEKLIARATAPLLQQIDELKQASGTSSDAMGQLGERMFVRDVQSRVPDMGAIADSPEWKEYLQRNIPLTRMRIQDALVSAHNERDLASVVSIFDAFKAEQGKNQPQGSGASTATAATASSTAAASTTALTTATATGLAQFATPDRSGANGSVRPAARFRESDYRARMDAMRAGRISKSQFLQFEQEFQEARSQGLVSKE